MKEKRGDLWSWIILGALVFFIYLCWFFRAGYLAGIAFATPVFCVILAAALLGTVGIRSFFKDREGQLVTAGCILALLNIFLVKSGKGAIFTIGSFFLLLYLSDKIRFTGRQKLILAALCIPYYAGWWFIKTTEYNTNTPGMIELGLFLLICLGLEEGKRRYPKVQFWLLAVEILLGILGMGVARHFHARSGFYGFLILFVLYFLGPLLASRRWMKRVLTVGVTVGAMFITLPFCWLYVHDFVIDGQRIPIDILNGREIAWIEFWNAWLKRPLTGIGSDFMHAIPNWSGLEAHNTLLSLLWVHGILVFALVLYLLLKRMSCLEKRENGEKPAWMPYAGIITMMVVGAAETFYCAGIYNGIFFVLLTCALQEAKRGVLPDE
ncbi:MAG: O-antigen ligase family protein [Lachnospiraceae bacterium]|nr:O-antigen ligase family protein [Lachnospiraceae bacterium]